MTKTRRMTAKASVPRSVPQAISAEQGVLGCMLLAPKEGVNTFVEQSPAGAEVFYDLRHQIICEALVKLVERHGNADIITLVEHLKDSGTLEEVGGVPYLSSLQDVPPSAANITYHLELVREKYLLRRTLEVCEELSQRIYNYEGKSDVLLDDAERQILAVRKHSATLEVPLPEVVKEALIQLEESALNQTISGIGTGLPDLDRVTDGLHKGEMTVIGAYPGIGKTSLAMNLAEHAVMKLGLSAGVFTLEMTSVELVKRCLCSHARVNLRNLKRGYLEATDAPKLVSSAAKMQNAKLYLDDTSDLSVYQLRAKARRWHHQHPLDLLVVDYLQLLNASGGSDRADSRQEEVSAISRGLKAMAKELKVPVVVLSQLNDDGKLRESRAIGQDADNVWQLEREDDEEETDGIPVHLFIEKQRNGPRGVKVPLTFMAGWTRFESRARVDDEDVPEATPKRKITQRRPYADDD